MATIREDFQRANERIRENLPREHGFEDAARVDGEIPAWLEATLYRNGPALQDRFGQHFGHSFEGDGAVTAVRVSGGKAQMATRFVRTPEFVEEEERGALLYGLGVSWFKRMSNTLRGKSKIPANVNVMFWQDRLLAVPEGGSPYEMDPDTLETLGRADLAGLEPGYHSPHPHRIESRKASYSFRILWGKVNEVSVFCYPDEGAAHELGRFALDAVYFHDFIATDDHLIFFVPPIRINILRAMSRIGPLRKIFDWRPELGTKVVVMPIDRPDELVMMDAPAFHVWHYANAFPAGEDRIHVDFSYWPDFSSFDAVGSSEYEAQSQPELRRATLDLRAKSFSMETLTDHTCEFPSVVSSEFGSPSQLIWSQTEDSGERGGVMLFDVGAGAAQRYMLDAGQVASEPNFVAKPGGRPGEGVVSMLCYDLASHTSFLALFDALHVEDGPVAKVWFDHHIPMTFHGLWR